tara:strand:+ start:72 stop:482 length:411 start_codon:yes stop_codon:yes gene_type:complete
MAHFAELNGNNVVIRVVVVDNNDTSNSDGEEIEQIGISFLKGLFGNYTNWKQTSYNGNFRVRYAGRGDVYDETLDAFISPKPFESWVLNSTTVDWEAPIEEPELTQEQVDSGYLYYWDETAYQQDNTTGWILDQQS